MKQTTVKTRAVTECDEYLMCHRK